MRHAPLLLFVLTLSSAPPAVAGTEIADSVAKLARIGSCFSPSFSPDGEALAFVSDMSGQPQVWAVRAGGGWPHQLTAFDDTISRAEWSPDGEWLAVSAAPGGGMNAQVYLVYRDGLTVRRITAGGQETNSLGPWSWDGKRLALSSNVDQPGGMAAYLYDLEDESLHLAGGGQGITRVADLSRDGRYALLDRLVGRGSNDLYLLDLESGAEALLTAHEGPGSFNGRFATDGKSVLLGTNKDRDRIAFARLLLSFEPLGAGETEILAARDDAELEGLAVSPSGELAVLVWNEAGRSRLELYHLGDGQRQPLDIGVDLIGGLSFSRDGNRLAFVGRGATLPTNVYGLDLGSGRHVQLTDCPRPGVDLGRLVRPELVQYKAHDGLDLSGWLYRPPGVEEPAPYVLSFHGGPEGQERPTLRPVYQALLAQGIGVFAPNIRGSSGFGKRFVNLDNRELRFDANRDLESSALFLVEKGIADRQRLGIMGGSYGGYAVMAAITDYPELFAAAVDLFGMVNFETFFEHTEPWMAAISGTEYGDPVTQRDLLRRLSPLYKLDGVKTPLLVQHGQNDTNVPVVEAEQVVENLKRRGVPVEYILFPDEGHGFRKAANRVRSTVATVEWFVEYLQ